MLPCWGSRRAAGACLWPLEVEAHASLFGVLPAELSWIPRTPAYSQFEKNAYDVLVEGEGHDRTSLLLTRLQERLWQV